MDVSSLSTRDLLTLHARIENLLRERKITRSSNNPAGDLAEKLFEKAFGWTLTGNSHKHTDAIGPDGSRYQIKARRMTKYNSSRQLSAIRDLRGANFDFLACVLFEENYGVLRAAIIPYSTVVEHSQFVAHTNSFKFFLREGVWEIPGVRDETANLRSVAL